MTIPPEVVEVDLKIFGREFMKKILCAIALLISTHSSAFDGSKEGFMLNLGLGYSYVDMSDSGVDISKKTGALGGALDLGWGIAGVGLFLGVPRSVFYELSGNSLVHAVTGIGAMFSLEHLYLSAPQLAWATSEKKYSLDLISDIWGEAFTFSVGLNLIRHLGLEFYTTYSKTGK